MKQTNYELIVKAVTIGMPVLARDIIQDLNDSLKELEKLQHLTVNNETQNVSEQQEEEQ